MVSDVQAKKLGPRAAINSGLVSAEGREALDSSSPRKGLFSIDYPVWMVTGFNPLSSSHTAESEG